MVRSRGDLPNSAILWTSQGNLVSIQNDDRLLSARDKGDRLLSARDKGDRLLSARDKGDRLLSARNKGMHWLLQQGARVHITHVTGM